jgi:tryptophanyl-tRNA synthetase
MSNSNVFLCGARPTGGFHIGHVLGAFAPMLDYAGDEERYFVIADLHSLTTSMRPEVTLGLHEKILGQVATLIAMGMSPEKFTFYVQSEILSQSQFFSIIQGLVAHAPLPDQPSYKSMMRSETTKPSLGLLSYPVLDTADIMSMQSSVVAIGEDNVHHLAVMDEIVAKLNAWGEHPFRRPRVVTGGANVPGLDGAGKMSKSQGNAILLTDSTDEIRRRVQSMAPGSGPTSLAREILTHLSPALAAQNSPDPTRDKELLIEASAAMVAPIRTKVTELMRERMYLKGLLIAGRERARERCDVSLVALKRLIGLSGRT